MLNVRFAPPSTFGINWQNPNHVREYQQSQNIALQSAFNMIRNRANDPNYVRLNNKTLQSANLVSSDENEIIAVGWIFERGVVINNSGGDYDSRIAGDNETNLFYVDAGNDRIGIATSVPAYTVDIGGYIRFDITTTTTPAMFLSEVAGHGFGLYANFTADEMDFEINSRLGNQIVMTDWSGRDHDHANTGEPAFYGHDGRDPAISNNMWWSLTHDRTGMVIATGANTGAGTGPVTIDNYVMFSPRGVECARFTGGGDLQVVDGLWLGVGAAAERFVFNGGAGTIEVQGAILHCAAKCGIGTATVPHGGVGAGIVAIEGTNVSAAAGPHMQFTVSTSNYPLLQILPYAHDSISFVLDAYFDATGWKSSDAGSNYRVAKFTDQLQFTYDSGIAAGAAVTWNTAAFFDTAGAFNVNDNIIMAEDTWIGITGPAERFVFDGTGGLIAVTAANLSIATGHDLLLTDLSMSIYGATDVEGALEALDVSQVAEINTGFGDWTSGADAATYTVDGTGFQIDRAGYGFIKGVRVAWAASIKTGALTANALSWIYVDSAGAIGVAESWSAGLYEDNIVLFECLYDGTNYTTVRDNHAVSFPPDVSVMVHNILGTMLQSTGANITRVASGTGGAAADREIKIVGADELHDHGLITVVPDSGGSGVTWNWYYTDGSGNWIRTASQTQAVMEYNSGGTATGLANGKYGVWRMYISKDDIESSAPTYFAVMGDGQYDNLLQARNAIVAGMPEATNELFGLELAQLGYIIVLDNANGGYVYEIQIEKSTVRTSTTGAGASNLASLTSVGISSFGGAPTEVLSSTDATAQNAFETINDFLKTAHTLTGNWLMSGTSQWQFRDSGIHIASLAADHLDVTATAIDLNGVVTVGSCAEMGAWPPVANFAYFGNAQLDHSVSTNYALLQDSNGYTYLNAIAGTSLRLRIGNSDRMVIANTLITISETVLIAGADPLQFRDTTSFINSANVGYMDYGATTAHRFAGNVDMDSGLDVTGNIAVSGTVDGVDVSGIPTTYLPLAGGTMAGAIAMGTNQITGMGDPTLDQDAATKKYVDDNAGGTPTKEFFVMIASGASVADNAYTVAVGWFPAEDLVAGKTARFVFHIPSDFTSLTEAVVVMIPDASETIQWDADTDYAAPEEAYDTHGEFVDNAQLAVTADEITEVDVSGIMSGVAANDYVGLGFKSETNTMRILGLRIKYA